MLLADSFNAIDNAILIVKLSGDYTKNGPYLKIVAGSKEKWRQEVLPRHGGIDAFVAAEYERSWNQMHGDISEKWFDINWANSIRADCIPYDGLTPLTKIEREAVTLFSNDGLTLDILWAAVEGMGWRPSLAKEPSPSQILDFFHRWRSSNSEPFDATHSALTLTLYNIETGFEAAEVLAERLLSAALLSLTAIS